MRVIGGFVKTTPIHVMEAELCLSPLCVRRLYLAGKFWLRSRSFSDNVTTKVIEELSNLSCGNNYWRRKKTPLLVVVCKKYEDQSVQSWPKLHIYTLDSWISSYDLSQSIVCDIEGIGFSKKSYSTIELRNHCTAYLNVKYDPFYMIFTDGSKEDSVSGAAFFDPQIDIRAKFRVNENISIMHSELIAISEALSYILSLNEQCFVVLSDSKSALQHLARLTSNLRGYPIAYSILDSIYKIRSTNKVVVIQWIPSHIGIMGNEEVDQAAKEAVSDGIPYDCLPLQSELLKKVKQMCRENWQEYFDERSRSKGIWYKTIQCELPRYPWFDTAERAREYIVALFRLRSGHIPSNKFKHLMGKSNSPNCSVCGTIEDVYHVLNECVRSEAQRRTLQCNINDVGGCNCILASPMSHEAEILVQLYSIFVKSV